MTMVLRFSRWDSGVALCLPADVAQRAHVTEGVEVDLTIEDGKLVLTPKETRTYTLDELLAGMTVEHVHGEIPTGRPVGNEAR
jgi:antitoxin MazE